VRSGNRLRARAQASAPDVRSWWLARRGKLLKLGAILLALEASIYLAYEFWRLLLEQGHMGAVDLHLRVQETHAWFDGARVYGRLLAAVYPPATYAILWPFTGWLHFDAVRWLWGAVTVASLAWLAVLLIRGSAAQRKLERALIVLMLVAVYPTGQTIGNGQLLTLVLPALLTALVLLQRPQSGVLVDVVAAALLVLALVKPTGAVPFLLLACFLPRGIRVVALACAGYAGLTLLAATQQSVGFTTLVRQWLDVSRDLAAYHAPAFYANVDAWLGELGLKSLIAPVAAAILALFALWLWRHRSVDLWLLIGVTALVARFWSYHQSYDDMLILLALVALFRIAKRGGARRDDDVAAGLLFAATLAVMVVPGGLFLFPTPLRVWFTSFETVVWLVGLVFLLAQARAARLTQGDGNKHRFAVPAASSEG
jgi:hypothetical protein